MIATETIKQRSLQGIERLAKASYIAKAVFYGSIAVFTAKFAFGERNADPSRKQVLEQLTISPFGKVLIAFIAVALAGHTLWRLFEIWNDPYKKGNGPGGWLYRLNYTLSAITYGGLGFTAVKLLLGKGSGDDNQKQIWVAKLLQIEGGDWLVILVGSIFITWAGIQFYKGLSGCVYKGLQLEGVNRIGKGFLWLCGLVGFLTVGSTLAGTGWYLIKGALAKDPHWVKNMDDIIKAVKTLPGGWGLQLGVATGFLLMGCFMLAMARYFPVKTIE
ncbi:MULTISPECIES: DUF1206 domain-containing protein [Spirosoma]|uniref:DUF1206 domain-containing protein n=1 Tax=Spirosoma liriopis TaxID=2937440 RepID=A0ABT0HMY0_9BACT|nr:MULTISPECIES: DUF1206 domain-containing protein [Spirosoma]MCK8493521.1 DUF1206 domain-containing protein [Spirosoma liriopis]UHG92959.1 DUF1206 domain-containing protein [Spirosoma oryzicola]